MIIKFKSKAMKTNAKFVIDWGPEQWMQLLTFCCIWKIISLVSLLSNEFRESRDLCLYVSATYVAKTGPWYY